MDSPLLGRLVASKLRLRQADKVFGGKAKEISEKMIFFTRRPVTWKRIEILDKRWKALYSKANKRPLGENWLRGSFDPVLVAQSRVRTTKCNPVSGVRFNKHGHNFQNIGSKMNQRLLIVYEPTLICFGSDILKIVTVSVLCDTTFTIVFFQWGSTSAAHNSA